MERSRSAESQAYMWTISLLLEKMVLNDMHKLKKSYDKLFALANGKKLQKELSLLVAE